MKTFWEMTWKRILGGGALLILINVYFGVLCGHRMYLEDLVYLDVLLMVCAVLYFYFAYHRWKRICRLFEKGMEFNRQEAESLLGRPITGYLFKMLEENKRETGTLMGEMNELTEYIAKWTHEVKLPLASLNLMNERNADDDLQQGMQDGLERIQQLLNTMLFGCKLKALENDVKYEKIVLDDVVKESLKNQSYFLIHEHFAIEKNLEQTSVYSDRRWLVYLLDQLIANAVKYRGDAPGLNFEAQRVSAEEVVLSVQDRGIGIPREELPYIFDKGYIGSNMRSGDYRSTGMGLYFVQKTAKRLGIRIEVISEQGRGTQFLLHFRNNAAFFIMDED